MLRLFLLASLLINFPAMAADQADASPKPKKPSSSAQQFQCGQKRTCGQMSSCAEARFHLKQCGIKRLDRDKDGVPCESLCR